MSVRVYAASARACTTSLEVGLLARAQRHRLQVAEPADHRLQHCADGHDQDRDGPADRVRASVRRVTGVRQPAQHGQPAGHRVAARGQPLVRQRLPRGELGDRVLRQVAAQVGDQVLGGSSGGGHREHGPSGPLGRRRGQAGQDGGPRTGNGGQVEQPDVSPAGGVDRVLQCRVGGEGVEQAVEGHGSFGLGTGEDWMPPHRRRTPRAGQGSAYGQARLAPFVGRSPRSSAIIDRDEGTFVGADTQPGPVAPAAPAAPAAPVATFDDVVLADLALAVDGLLWHDEPLGGPVPSPAGGEPGSASVVVDAATASQAVAAGRLVVADAEAIPVAALVLPSVADGPSSGDGTQVVLSGRLSGSGRLSTGPGHDLRLGARPVAPERPDPSSGGPVVVVVGRPLLTADEARVAEHVQAGRQVVLVVPVSGPSSDGLPVAVMLRLASGSARRTGATVRAATLSWRDAVSDAHLVQHVVRALEASDVEVLGRGASTDGAWSSLLSDHRAGRGPQEAPGETAVLAELDRWWPPPSRRGLVVLFSGLSGSGKSTLARAVAEHVEGTTTRKVSLLDGDHVRRMLSAGLGFDRHDRELNVLRIGFVATEVARHGGMAVCAPIAPYASTRQQVREMVQQVGDFVLVHVSTPLEECERRDLKGLYARARAGEIAAFTGISDPYEEPDDADVVVDTSELTPEEALSRVLDHLRSGTWLPPEESS